MKLQFAPALLISLVLLACNNGGSSRIAGGVRCAQSLVPVQMELDQKDNEKVIDLKGSTTNLPAGNYTYEGANVYYHDNATGMMMLYVDFKAPGATEFSPKISCVRNYEILEGFDVRATAISSMTVNSSSKTFINLRTYRIAFEGKERIAEFKDGDQSQNQVPSKPYTDNKASDYFMMKMDDKNTSFEIRSKFPVMDEATGTERGSLYILTRLTRTDLSEH